MSIGSKHSGDSGEAKIIERQTPVPSIEPKYTRKNGEANLVLSNGLVLGALHSESLGPGLMLEMGVCFLLHLSHQKI